jgi:tetratricopeptide (TPR) repeat protein
VKLEKATTADIVLSLVLPGWGLIVGLIALTKDESRRGFTMLALSIPSLALIASIKLLATPTQASTPRAASAGATLNPDDSKALLAEVDRLKDSLKDKPKNFEVLGALGNLYYENGRYLEAIDSFRQALELAAPVEAQADALRKQGVKPAAELPAECRRAGPEYGLQQIAEAAKKMEPPKARRCLESVLEMALSVRARRGNALYLIGNPDGALAEHRKVLERSPDHPESLFFVGAILLEQSQGDKAKLAEGKKYWERLLKVAPDNPRAALVKETLPKADEVFKPQMPKGHPAVDQGLPPGHPPVGPMAHAGPTEEEVSNLQEAVQNTERTPELEKGLDELLAQGEKALDEGKYQEARDAVVRVMPMRPNDARTAAALGGAMRGLGRLEMAERTLSTALRQDPKQPRALYEMGKLEAQRGDKARALQDFQALQAADARWAQAHHVDEEIARLR